VDGLLRHKATGYAAAVIGVAAVTAVCAPLHAALNDTTVALALLLVVLLVATRWGSWPAVVASLLGTLSFNYFFLPPLYTLTIADPQNWVALTAFLATALAGGHLSARAERHAAEADAARTATAKSAEEIRDLYNRAPCGYHSLDEQGILVQINDTELEWLGYSREELIGRRPFADLLAPGSVQTFTQAFPRLKTEGLVRDVELDLVRRDGTLLPVLLSATAVTGADGRFVMSRSTVYDLTERKRAEAEVRSREARHAATVQAALDAIVAIDARGAITEFNPAAERMFGWRREEVLGREMADAIIPPSLRPRHRQGMARHLATGEAAMIGRRVELTALRANGEEFPVELAIARIASAGPAEFVGYIRDITERTRAEEAVRRSEANLNRAQEVAHIGSWHLDIVRNRLTWSREVFRIFGVPPETGLTYEAFIGMVHSEDRQAVDTAWSAAMRGAPYDIEHRIIVGGEVKWVRERAKLEFDEDGRAIEGIGTVQDVTQRKRYESELLRLNRAHRALASCNEALIRITDESAWLEKVCRLIVDEAGYRLCWIGHAESDEAKTVRPVAQAGFDEGYVRSLNVTWADTERGRGPTGTCIRTGQIQAVRSIATDPRVAAWRQDAVRRGYASSIGIPIVVGSEIFGALSIYSAEADAFHGEEVKLLSELAGDLGYGIATLRTRAERERAEAEIRTLNAELEQRVAMRTAELQKANGLKDELIVREQAAAAELAAAREREGQIGFRIQQMLLLTQPPRDVAGLQVAALTIPSQRIDGDFYDFSTHENQSLDVIVADVMGKGVPAALLAAATKSNFLEALCHLMALSRGGTLPEPRDIVTLAHADMVGHLIALESFVTLSYARLDLNRHRLDLVDCGHTGMIVVPAATGQCQMLHGDNLPLGIRAGEVFGQMSVPFEPGDLFLFYSDGLTDICNAAGERFGAARLSDCVGLHRRLDPEALVEAIRSAVFAFAASDVPNDDLTCVAIKVGAREVPVARDELEIGSDLRELRRVREFVRSFGGVAGGPLDEDGLAELELAVNEAASNIVRHAYHGRADQRIHLDIESYPNRIAVRLHHLGDAFDPSAVAPPHLDGLRESGFGLYLIGRCVDEVRHYRDERGRNCIALAKARKPQG
jgi:PAS domain S-box-containing protein